MYARSRRAAAIAALALALGAALPAAGTASAGPAEVSPAALVATLECESIARRILCSASHSGAVGAVTIHWYVNGSYFSYYDNRTFVGLGCAPYTVVPVRVVITASNGSDDDSRSTTCQSGNP